MLTGLAAITLAVAAMLTPHQRHLVHCHRVPSACPSAALAPLPVWTPLLGAQATAWSTAALHQLGAPVSAANKRTMYDWYQNEGIPHDYNNPLNLETPVGGDHPSSADGDPLSVDIQAYTTPADFVAAFAIEMHDSRYKQMLAHLLAGTGLEGAQGAAVRSELNEYSGGGYDSIPAAYCPCS